MIDSHAHILSEYYDDIESFIEKLKDKDILKVINCADSISTSKEVLDLYRKYDGRDGVKQTHLPGVFLREVRSDK